MDEIARATAWVEQVVKPVGLASDKMFAIRLCLEEALANVVKHGLPQGVHQILVDVFRDAEELVVTIADGGGEFDPTSAATPERAEKLEQAEGGGFGLVLLRSYASRLEYRRYCGHNILKMGFALRA